MDAQKKIMSRAKLATVLRRLQKKGLVIGLTNGVFDMVHAGHVAYLREARRHCDVLVASLNTDASVRQYKSPARPLVPLKQRQQVMAELSSVDYVTSHGERRMKKTLTLLKPDLYIKGGDYDVTQLTSRSVVEAYGGRALVLSLKKGMSTTALIRKAQHAASVEGLAIDIDAGKGPAAFLDRDGVILENVPHLHDPRSVRLAKGVVAGLKKLQKAGFKLVVITNQPGIGMGYFTREAFFKVNSRMLYLLFKAGIMLDAVYFCPHSPAKRCDCRKPKTGMLVRARREQGILKAGSIFMGDREMDMQAARTYRIPGVLVGPGDSPAARRLAQAQGDDFAKAVDNYFRASKRKGSR